MVAGADVLPRGLPLRVMTGFAIASAATLLVAVIWLAEPDPVTDSGPADLVRVGVVDGQSVPGYLRSSRGELTALARAPGATDTWALVTLQSYLPPDRLLPVLSGVAVAQVYARAPLDGAQTQVERIPVYRMPDDVIAGMLVAATRRDQERADYQQLSHELDRGDANEVRLRHAYDRAARVAGDEATAYRAHCSCVFAAVIRGAPATLAAIAGRAGVRAVDPAPEVYRLDRAEFRPPLPEQRTTVLEETRTAIVDPPRAASSVAPARSAPLPSSTGARTTLVGPSVLRASEEHSAGASVPVLSEGPGAPTATAGASGR
jgi:hypothetical protein